MALVKLELRELVDKLFFSFVLFLQFQNKKMINFVLGIVCVNFLIETLKVAFAVFLPVYRMIKIFTFYTISCYRLSTNKHTISFLKHNPLPVKYKSCLEISMLL